MLKNFQIKLTFNDWTCKRLILDFEEFSSNLFSFKCAFAMPVATIHIGNWKISISFRMHVQCMVSVCVPTKMRSERKLLKADGMKFKWILPNSSEIFHTQSKYLNGNFVLNFNYQFHFILSHSPHSYH